MARYGAVARRPYPSASLPLSGSGKEMNVRIRISRALGHYRATACPKGAERRGDKHFKKTCGMGSGGTPTMAVSKALRQLSVKLKYAGK